MSLKRNIRQSVICLMGALPALAQQPPQPVPQEQVPIYQITVERRSIRAVNYGHNTATPTKIDFRGTVLLSEANGEAKVKSEEGAVAIDAKFHKLGAPARFGPAYLTYVLWAITPEGRPVNLGEVFTDGDDNGKLKATTHFQAFGLIVTAEPYYSVTQPSNIVVLENWLRPDTVGRVEEVEAKYELLPRNPVAPQSVQLQSPPAEKGRPVSIGRYNAIVALYQAQNSIQIARSQGAGRYAAETLGKAEQLYAEANRLHSGKRESKRVVTMAREAAQTAEDARAIAVKRQQNREQPAAQARR